MLQQYQFLLKPLSRRHQGVIKGFLQDVRHGGDLSSSLPSLQQQRRCAAACWAAAAAPLLRSHAHLRRCSLPRSSPRPTEPAAPHGRLVQGSARSTALLPLQTTLVTLNPLMVLTTPQVPCATLPYAFECASTRADHKPLSGICYKWAGSLMHAIHVGVVLWCLQGEAEH